jgi:hypothetical protein
MSSTPQHLLEILARVGHGKHLGGGDVPHATLQADVELLIGLWLLESAGGRLSLTDLGSQVLAAAIPERRPAPNGAGRGSVARR